jgi:acyl-CoA thioester hydrolase
MNTKEQVLEFRVYLEDTDAQGIVYYANYLRFFERGRSEFLESLGIPMSEVARPDCRLVVYEIRMKFRRPASLGDRIEVVTAILPASDTASHSVSISVGGEKPKPWWAGKSISLPSIRAEI